MRGRGLARGVGARWRRRRLAWRGNRIVRCGTSTWRLHRYDSEDTRTGKVSVPATKHRKTPRRTSNLVDLLRAAAQSLSSPVEHLTRTMTTAERSQLYS